MKRLVYQDRDECAGWMVNIWRDAVAFKQTQKQVHAGMARVRESRKYKRLPQYMRQYVEGFARCYQVNVIDRQFLEHGNWVIMPDGSTQWFGLRARINSQSVYNAGIDYRYLSENSIPERTGIYWVADEKLGIAEGTKPYFISALDFDQTAFDARMAAKEVTA